MSSPRVLNELTGVRMCCSETVLSVSLKDVLWRFQVHRLLGWAFSGLSSAIVLHAFSPLHTVAWGRKTGMTACFRSCQGSVLLGVFIATESPFCWLLGGGSLWRYLINCFATYWHRLVCRVRPEGRWETSDHRKPTASSTSQALGTVI